MRPGARADAPLAKALKDIDQLALARRAIHKGVEAIREAAKDERTKEIVAYLAGTPKGKGWAAMVRARFGGAP